MDWTRPYARRTGRFPDSELSRVLRLTRKPGVISFAGGLPAPEIFPVAQIKAASDAVLEQDAEQALQYNITEGFEPLRQWIINHLDVPNDWDASNVQIVTGSQQGLSMIGKALLDPGDKIAVELPSYFGGLRVFDSYEIDYLGVETDEDGVLPDSLERALAQKPKFLYVMPTFQNPRGTTMSLERRHATIELARKYGVPIVEDDAYGRLRFEGTPLPSLVELAPDMVLYVSTFSKILAPGMRLAWLAGPKDVIHMMMRTKQTADMHTPMLTQLIAHRVATEHDLDGHVNVICQLYREHRDAMLAAMEEYFPAGVTWNRPAGGMFLWVTLPVHMKALNVLTAAVEHDVAFIPGDPFFADGSGKNTLRLSYSKPSSDTIREGIRRLGQVLHEQLEPAAIS
jgi:2-aminoadipate transaminase